MKQFICNNPILLDRFSQHSLYKTSLLNYFDKEEFFNENYKDDNITKVDWHKAKDFNRPWVKLIIEDLHKHFLKFANHMGFEKCMIDELWFQQYNKNGHHGWHVHGHNYTGVYYVNWNKECAKTRYVDPITQEVKDIEAEEGDVVIFPSTVIHRANTQEIDFPKIIISFNISFDNIQRDKLNQYENA
jgi:uncharacterized protein YjlB